MPITTPPSLAAHLAHCSGRYYTQGMPEDTNAAVGEILDRGEFMQQARIAGHEVIRQYDHVLEEFDEGLLFYYFGNLDLISHVMYRTIDPEHPAYDPEEDPQFADVIPDTFEELDGVVGMTLDRMDPDTLLVVMSDHGFTSVRREFHLNAWLKQNGYLAVLDPNMKKDPGLFLNVDWSRTKAYGVGLNGLYINLRGRERNGIVSPSDREALMDEISQKLLAQMDEETGLPAVTKMYARETSYVDRGQLELGPDLQVGYGPHMHCSGDSALGKVGNEIITDNHDHWNGNHAMDHELVPGVLLVSRPLKQTAPDLKHLAASILAEFGVPDFPRTTDTSAETAAAAD
jgi:predicted AlkP superfamily phosphohydrolase/phosphomutase